jgi:hypothetical protein
MSLWAAMQPKAPTLTGYSLHAIDGEIGKVKDFYFGEEGPNLSKVDRTGQLEP